MLITKIELQKKNSGRVNVYVDGSFAFGTSADCVLKFHLKEGMELNDALIEHIKTDGERELCVARAMKYLGRALKTEREVATYLLSKGFSPETVNFALCKLKEYGFVDDERFVKSFVKFKSSRQGIRKTKFELERKGIDTKKFLGKIDEPSDEHSTACELLEKYLKNKPLDLKTKQKAYRFLAGKGFLSENVMFAINKFFDGDE